MTHYNDDKRYFSPRLQIFWYVVFFLLSAISVIVYGWKIIFRRDEVERQRYLEHGL